jgi:iron complex transport system ATP-binding protein
MVLVTHHVEEIIPIFSHVLILKGGRVLANGPIRQTLNSATLSSAFGEKATLRRTAGRYQLLFRGSRSAFT